MLAAKSIGYSQRLQRPACRRRFAQLGLSEQIKDKIKITDGGTARSPFFLARGDFEIGIQQTNIMVGASGHRLSSGRCRPSC